MKPNWQKLAGLAMENAHSSFSSLVLALLPKDTLLRTYLHVTPLYITAIKISFNQNMCISIGNLWEGDQCLYNPLWGGDQCLCRIALPCL